MRIAIIEDELSIADTLIHVLKRDSFQVSHFSNGHEGVAALHSTHFDLLILDVGLPDISGFDLCKQIRGFSSIPIIFLTARSDEIDRVVGLEIGGDDYVTKPFSPREVLARVKLRLPKTQKQASENTTLGLIQEQCDFKLNDEWLNLTAFEFKLLQKLYASPGQIFSREQLLSACNVPEQTIYARNIDSHIKSIRNKIRAITPQFEAIKTKRGFGYFYE